MEYKVRVKGFVDGKRKEMIPWEGQYTRRTMEYSSRVFQEQHKDSLCWLLFDAPHGKCTAYTILKRDTTGFDPKGAA